MEGLEKFDIEGNIFVQAPNQLFTKTRTFLNVSYRWYPGSSACDYSRV